MFGLSVNTDVRDDDTPSAWRASIRAGPQAGSPARRVPPDERAALAVAQRVHRHAARANDLHAERADAGSAARRSHRPRAADHLDGTDPAGADHRRLHRGSPCDGARLEREGAADDLARPAMGASRSRHGTSRGRSGPGRRRTPRCCRPGSDFPHADEGEQPLPLSAGCTDLPDTITDELSNTPPGGPGRPTRRPGTAPLPPHPRRAPDPTMEAQAAVLPRRTPRPHQPTHPAAPRRPRGGVCRGGVGGGVSRVRSARAGL